MASLLSLASIKSYSITKSANYLVKSFGVILIGLILLSGVTEGLQERMHTLGNSLSTEYNNWRLLAKQQTPSPCINDATRISFQENADLDALLAATDLNDLLTHEQTEPVLTDQKPTIRTDQCNAITENLTEQSHLQTDSGRETKKPPLLIALVILIEEGLAATNLWLIGHQSILLSCFLVFALVSATHSQKHLAIHPDHQHTFFPLLAQLMTNGLLLYSCTSYALILINRSYSSDAPEPYVILAIGFGINCLYALMQLGRKLPAIYTHQWRIALIRPLSIPIYCWMVLLPSVLGSRSSDIELALLLGQFYEMPLIYLHIALYIWIGMLIKHSRLPTALFNTLTSLPLPSLMLALLVVAFMAIPTAFTGASGIIILATGSIIYAGLVQLQLRKQLAIAITALTGSTGVVLSPCLLIVAIAFLNKEVTTDELFHWGMVVFTVTLSILAITLNFIPKSTKLTSTTPTQINLPSFRDPLTSSLFKRSQLLSYALLIILLALILNYGFGLSLNEFSAPYFLPLLFIAVLAFEHQPSKNSYWFDKTILACNESYSHSGAILVVMLASYTLGNTSFNQDVMTVFAFDQLTIIETLWIVILILVGIGMILDPFGALVLVSMTIAPVAYQQGINPIHFWMMALLAFELGYVTPPVALNQLLIRQQLSDGEYQEAMKQGREMSKEHSGLSRFYLKYEYRLLPIWVLVCALLLVTFIPVFDIT